MITHYQTATGTSTEGLDSAVAALIAEGYQPIMNPYATSMGRLCQPMVKVAPGEIRRRADASVRRDAERWRKIAPRLTVCPDGDRLGSLFVTSNARGLATAAMDPADFVDDLPAAGDPDPIPHAPEYESEGSRRRLAIRGACMGALAAALGEPMHAVARSGFEARTIGADAWEDGHGYITSSAMFEGYMRDVRRHAQRWLTLKDHLHVTTAGPGTHGDRALFTGYVAERLVPDLTVDAFVDALERLRATDPSA